MGLVLGVTFPALGSLLGALAEEIRVASVTLLRPRPVREGLLGETRPWIVLETRAETVTLLWSGDAGWLWGLVELMELSEETESVAVRGGFVSFSDTSGGVFTEPVHFSAPFTATAGNVAASGEEGLGDPDANDLAAPGWTGGRGARYLTLVDCDFGVVDCVGGEVCLVIGVPDGIGGAGDLIDLGLGACGLGWEGPPDASGLRGPEEGWGWAGRSAGRIPQEGGRAVCSPEDLLSSRMVNS